MTPLLDYTNFALLPQLIVFDLDFTLWFPEMYELDGAPFSKHPKTGIIRDRSGEQVHLFDPVRSILHDLHVHDEMNSTQVAVASSTNYRKWAERCMELFTIHHPSQIQMEDVINYRAIYPKNKQVHFKQLHEESGIPYDRMLFFDNAYYNIEDVSPLGVLCIHCPDGLTLEHWESGLKQYAERAKN